MIYKDYLSSKKEIEKTIELLKEEKSKIETEIGAYTFRQEKSILDFQNYIKLTMIDSYYANQIRELEEKARVSENQAYKDLYIATHGKESEKDWRGIIL